MRNGKCGVKLSMAFLAVLFGCRGEMPLDFVPERVYGLYTAPLHVMDGLGYSPYKDKRIFNSNEEIETFFLDESRFSVGWSRPEVFDVIASEVDFSSVSLLAFVQEEGTGSYVHYVQKEGNVITVHAFCGEVVTNDIACDYLMIAVEKDAEAEEFDVSYCYQVLDEAERAELHNAYPDTFRF